MSKRGRINGAGFGFVARPLADCDFGSHDAFAIGVIHTLTAHGIKIPEDISVMGINDISVSRYVSPPLSSVKHLLKRWVKRLELLYNRIENPGIARRIFLSTQLVIRQSTTKQRRLRSCGVFLH